VHTAARARSAHSVHPAPDFSAAQAIADTIHQRLNFRRPPFRFEEFLSAHDAYKVFEVDLPFGLDGRLFLTPDGEQKTIHLRKDNTRPRIRFTLAHEIMHAELHFAQGQLQDLTACRTVEHAHGQRPLLEREADFGAAALLIPLWMLDDVLPYRLRHDYPDHVVREMTRIFRVSDGAMRIQLKRYTAHAGEFQRPL